MKTALVLSGGGMFGAWQAGAWRALAEDLQPDLVVGASVGSLNGYAIAGGIPTADLVEFWQQPEMGAIEHLPRTARHLIDTYSPQCEYAVVLTNALRMKPEIFQRGAVTWQHLAASCAVPGVLRPYRIHGRWYTDGGLLNPLPVWAAVELGATRIVAIHVLPEIPSIWLRPFVKGFRNVVGHHPPLPAGVELTLLKPSQTLGSMTDALRWNRENVSRWLADGYAAAKNISIRNCLER